MFMNPMRHMGMSAFVKLCQMVGVHMDFQIALKICAVGGSSNYQFSSLYRIAMSELSF